ILGLAAGGVVAARDQDCGLVSRRHADLMAVDAGIELAGLAHRLADGAVAVDAMHGDIARGVVGGGQNFAGAVDPGGDRGGRRGLGGAWGGGGAEPGWMRKALARCVVPATPGPPLLDTT